MTETDVFVIENARIVLAERVIERGYVAVANGLIAEIGEGRAPERGIDAAGDLVLPGLVELHTDHIEAHYMPRPKVRWDLAAAVISYDAQIATSGITTVLDSLRVWREHGSDDIAVPLSDAIADARTRGLLRVSHFLHLRCEAPVKTAVEDAAALIERADVRLVSVMDHTPGQRQFRDEQKLRAYYRGKGGGLTDAELDALFAGRLEAHARYADANYKALVNLVAGHKLPLASHDDTTDEHVAQSVANGAVIAEFPTTAEAAAKLHAAGVKVLMGAPNLVRGGSHSGNIATAELAATGTLDILSSDYVPSSLLMGALALPQVAPRFDLPAAIRTVSKTPAEVVGLTDRGEIAPGKRGDLIRVHAADAAAAVRCVWSGGRRVA